jgi:hypothetical protein
LKNFVDFILAGLFLCVIGNGCTSNDLMPEVPEYIMELENLTVYQTDSKISTILSFKQDAIYGDTEDVFIGNIRDIAVDDIGRVFIADPTIMVVHAFDTDGQYIGQLGREGRGPGEFSNIRSLNVHRNRLYAYDPSQYRMHIFTLHDLTGEKTVNLAENRGSFSSLAGTMPWIQDVYVRSDDTYIATFLFENKSPALQNWENYEVMGLFYQLNNSGRITGELFEFKSETRTRYPIRNVAFDMLFEPFFGKTLMVVSSDNYIYLAMPDNFMIKQLSPNGAYHQSFFYPIGKLPISKETAIEAELAELYINEIQNLDLPEFWPVVTDMKIDNQDRLWIAITAEDMSVLEWWVLENTGESITRFEWPRSKPIQVIKNDHIYTLETDEETDLQQIVRYRIEINEQ